VQDVHAKHEHRVGQMPDSAHRLDRLCELNVIEQVVNVSQTTIVRDAWDRGHKLSVHGWVYGLKDGLVRDLDISVSNAAETSAAYQRALAAL
jgi:carbonic anhydrase